jgi:hypothetical protein
MAEDYSYLNSGANQSLIRTAGDEVQFDSANIEAIIEAGSISDKQVKTISADKLSAGTISAVTNIGNDSVVLDGEDASIKLYDSIGRLGVYIQGS